MKKLIFGLIFFLLLALPINAIREQEPHDGYWWADWNDSFRLGYVIGLSGGISHCDLAFNGLCDRFISDSTSLDDCKNILLLYRDFLLEFEIRDITCGQMRDGISALYEDYRNKRLLAINLLSVVKMQVAGKSEAEINSVLQGLRQISSEAK
jgi:hypothetical protein